MKTLAHVPETIVRHPALRVLRGVAAAGVLAVLAAAPLAAQAVEGGWPPGTPTSYVLVGGTVHTLTGPPLENTRILIREGRIAAIGSDVAAPSTAEVIDITGLHVYPGMFDAVSRLGLTEIGAVDVTADVDELGSYTPHLQAATAVHPASEHIPVTRANGITHTVAAPGGGVLPGQGSLIHLAGWTVEEMAIETGVAMVLDFPQIQTRRFDFETFSVVRTPFREAQEEYRERVRELEAWLEAARHYEQARNAGGVERDLRLEALVPVVNGELPVLIRADGERNIRNAVEFAREHGLRAILTGGREADKVADLLAEHDIPVILGPVQTLPTSTDEAYDEPYAAPGKLHAAGVRIAFATFDASSARTLPYEAGTAVAYGLPHDEAIRAVTVNAAEMLGVADRIGTIETGKVANLIVTTGDPLSFTTDIRYLFVDGKRTSLDNKHQQLYERYRARPE